MYKKFLFLSGVLLCLQGCSVNEVGQTHKEKGPELVTIMRDLNSVIANNQKSELERDDDRRREAMNIVDGIREFSKRLQTKEGVIETSYITAENAQLFYKHLDRFSAKADEIEKTVDAYEMKQLDNRIVELKNICTACHRDLGVEHVQNLF